MTFVGRARALSRLLGVAEEAVGGRTRLALVAGEAGIGKTTLVGEFAARSSLRVGWGTCADAERTPAFWPWTVALRGLLTAMAPMDAASLARTDVGELARLLPELSSPPATGSGAGHLDQMDANAARMQLFDAVARFLERMARNAPTLIVLDDLQWADESTLALLDFVVRPYRPVPLVLVGAYRHDELGAVPAQALGKLAAYGEPVQLGGLSPEESYALVAEVVGVPAAERWAGEVHRRTDGHPFFARQLAEVLADPTQPAGAVPAAASDLVARRVARLSVGCRALVEAAAVAGNELQPDVLGDVCGIDAHAVAVLIEEGVHAGVLVRDSDGLRTWLAHDLYRESISAGLALPQRLVLHQRIADALEHRQARGAVVVAADVARHCAAAVPLGGTDRAVAWARSAAQVERAKLAFDHAASHLARARGALEDLGDPKTGGYLVDLLIEEADARARAGDSTRARVLLDDARDRASALGDAERLGRVALGKQRLGARFAMPRDAVVESARGRPNRAAGDGNCTGGSADGVAGPRAAPLHPRPAVESTSAVGGGDLPRPPARRPGNPCCVPAGSPRHPLDP